MAALVLAAFVAAGFEFGTVAATFAITAGDFDPVEETTCDLSGSDDVASLAIRSRHSFRMNLLPVDLLCSAIVWSRAMLSAIWRSASSRRFCSLASNVARLSS